MPTVVRNLDIILTSKLAGLNMLEPHNHDNKVPSHISRLPIELLIEIFTFCSWNQHGSPLAPLILSHVCHHWRQIIFISPLVWQNLSLDDHRSLTSMASQSQLWLEQSQQLPIDICVDVSNQDLMFPMFLPLLEHMHRWRRCIIIGKAIEAINFTSFSRNGSKAFFDEMHITIQGIPELQDTNIPHLPTFYSDSPHGVSMRISVLSLPDPALMSSFHLCHLRIEECSPGVIPNPLRMLQFLTFCPQLWTFRYHGYPHEPGEEWKTNERPSIVNLEKLRVLGIKGTCAVRTVLSHIHAPSLVELHLEHTNMEFEPSSVARYPYGVEDGDSDDEAQDFSQSPWSDHATGMGLRSLLRRSRPRLEILVMDYADMRTKDFVWCFDRLPALEKFRIVASDMSDKVIGMFAPYEEGVKVKERWPIGDIRDRWDGTPGMGIEGIEVGMKVVRMPKLRMLELWNCQRLSGDAMVHALQARIRLTDRVADGNLLMKMEDVAIVGCADFMPRHAIDLALDLGPRLRI